jgi:hypothetical protein
MAEAAGSSPARPPCIATEGAQLVLLAVFKTVKILRGIGFDSYTLRPIRGHLSCLFNLSVKIDGLKTASGGM